MGTGSDWGGNGVGLVGNEVGLGGTRLDWAGTISDWGERDRTRRVGRGYRRRGQLIWLHSLPLITPRPPTSN